MIFGKDTKTPLEIHQLIRNMSIATFATPHCDQIAEIS